MRMAMKKRFKTAPKAGAILLCILLLLLVGCGSSGDDGVTGTGIVYGTAATGDAIANSEVETKSLSGDKQVANTNAQGKFEIDDVLLNEPFLMRTRANDGKYYYNIGHYGDDKRISRNLHPYTDLIARNWFAVNSLDINSEFESTRAINSLPTQQNINDIEDEMNAIIVEVLASYGVTEAIDLLASEFDADESGFDNFLLNNPVIINNNQITVIVNDQATGIESVVIGDISLTTDFTAAVDTAPSEPGNVRALIDADQTEIVVVWEVSSDDKGIAKYNVYRNDELVGTTPYPVYFDPSVEAANSYLYSVEAVDGRGQKSDLSIAAQSISLDTADTTSPPSPSPVSVVADMDDMAITWTQSSIFDVANFRVMRGAQGNVNTEIATITSTAYMDFNLQLGTEYCYQIIAQDAAGNASLSSEEVCDTTAGTASPSSMVLSAATYQVSEQAGTATITVNRVGDISEAISVDYNVSGGSATAGDDYFAGNDSLNWAENETGAKTFAIQITADGVVESNETVNISLTNPSTNSSLGSISEAVLTITDTGLVTCIDLEQTQITTDTTLAQLCYNVNDTIVVEDAATLTIEPGVTLKFAAGTELSVESDGVLVAKGTSSEKIIFTGQLAASGFWRGLEIESIATSELDHTIVEYGGGSSFNEAAIGISFQGKASISNSLIRHSSAYGVSQSGSDSRIELFENNIVTLNEDAPLYVYAYEVGKIASNNQLSGNVTSIGGDRDYVDIINGSSVNSDQTWALLDVPYLMDGLDVDARLSLSPGVNMVFRANARLIIPSTGTLVAVGTASQPIVFTGEEETDGFWTGIQFNFNNNANVMNHVVVEYAGTGGNTDANVGVFGQDGRLELRNALVQHSANAGFYFDSGIDLVLENITSTKNNIPGIIGINDVGLLDKASVYSGNTDDRLHLFANPGVIDRTQTMFNIGIPYYARRGGNISVDAQFTVEPGVELQFNASGGFNIGSAGTFVAQGTLAEPIVFTGAQQAKGYWNGFQFTFSSNPNVLDHTVVEYAGSTAGNTNALVGFFGTTSSPASGNVTNTVLRGSLTNGIELSEGSTGDFVSGNTFEDIDGDNILDPR